jgi:hypothetical protein
MLHLTSSPSGGAHPNSIHALERAAFDLKPWRPPGYRIDVLRHAAVILGMRQVIRLSFLLCSARPVRRSISLDHALRFG